jgi:hypothetical protein
MRLQVIQVEFNLAVAHETWGLAHQVAEEAGGDSLDVLHDADDPTLAWHREPSRELGDQRYLVPAKMLVPVDAGDEETARTEAALLREKQFSADATDRKVRALAKRLGIEAEEGHDVPAPSVEPLARETEQILTSGQVRDGQGNVVWDLDW